MILAITTLWPILTVFVLLVCVSYICCAIYFTQKKSDKLSGDIIKRIDGRIWDIPVELRCQMCKSDIDIDFSLETNHFKCPKCNGYNKVMVQFITVATDDSWTHKK